MTQPLIKSISAIWENIFPRSSIKPTDDFFFLGGDSLSASAMVLEVERLTGLPVPVGQIYVTPILAEFAAFLEKQDPDDRAPLYIPLKDTAGGRPLFGIAPAKGGVFHFRELATALSDSRPFHIIEPKVSATGVHPYESIRDLALCCLDTLKSKQPQGPYALIGYSFGGTLAWEMARVLEEQNERVDSLILLDSSSRNGYQSTNGDGSKIQLLQSKWNFFCDCRNVRKHLGQSFRPVNCMRLLARKVIESTVSSLPHAGTEGQRSPVGNSADAMKVPSQENLRSGYDPGMYNGKLYLLRAEQQLTLHRELDLDLGWSKHLPEKSLIIRHLPGDHFSMTKPPCATHLAREIEAILDQAEMEHASHINAHISASQGLPTFPFEEPVNGESLVERLRTIATALPDHEAIRDGGTVLTYKQLDEAACRIADYLINKHPKDKNPVFLHFEMSWQFICALYGVLYAGRCYVPADTEFPDLRIQQIVKASNARMGVSLRPDRLSDELLEELEWLSFDKLITHKPIAKPFVPIILPPEAPATILFTSGSSGRPKGTPLPLKMILHLCWRRSTSCGFSLQDRYAITYLSAFMGGANGIHSLIMSGATLCLYNLRRRGVMGMPQWLREERVTVLHMITSILRSFLVSWNSTPKLPDLRLLIPGGERSRKSDIELWKSTCSKKVHYATCLGSTECGTLSIKPLPHEFVPEEGPLPVGTPTENMGVRILREDGSEADPLEEGQVTVESHYIFRGYLNEPALNEKVLSFTPGGKSIYRTGDFGFLDAEGTLYNAGRRDSRIKINGNLVELAEIESVLMSSGMIEDCVVTHRPISVDTAEPELVVFYRSKSGASCELQASLVTYLVDRLTRSMIPHRWVHLPIFPQTTNGKTDIRALNSMNLPGNFE